MNEVKKCSLSGIAFTMDNEAYAELKNYLDSLKKSYKDSADGAEIVADIEARIAELILSTQNNTRVVELPLIKNIIEQMGSAEEISDKSDEAQPKHTASERYPRRLYRDMERAKLGGVCAGIGKYFDIDPVWIRLLMFAPILLICLDFIPFLHWVSDVMGNLFGVFLIGYLAMWFAVPVARTARQKLEMNGEPITAQNIASTAASNDPDAQAKAVMAETVSTGGKILLMLMKLFAGLVVFGLVLVACALALGMLVVSIGSHEFVPTDIPLSMPILAILFVLIPILILIYALMCLIASRKPNGKTAFVGLILWLISLLLLVVITIRSQTVPQLSSPIEKAFTGEVLEEKVEFNGEEITIDELIKQLEGNVPVTETTSEAKPEEAKIKIEADDKHVEIGVGKAGFTVSENGKPLVKLEVTESTK